MMINPSRRRGSARARRVLCLVGRRDGDDDDDATAKVSLVY